MSRTAREIAATHASLTGYVRQAMAGAPDAEDIVQESWLRVAESPDPGAIRHLGAYLRNVATNLIRDRHRRSSLRIEIAVPEEVTAEIACPRTGIEALLITRQELVRMKREIAALPPRSRQVFRMARIDGLSLAEIARQLGLSRQTVHEHMTRALMALQAADEADPT